MLPGSFWQSIEAGFDPVVGSLFPTGGAESGFAGVRNLDAPTTVGTNKDMISEEACAANKDFQDIDYDTFSD